MRSFSSAGARWTLVAVVLVAVLLGLSACGGSDSSSDQNSNIETLAADDPSIADAREEAQTGWNAFVASFRAAKPGLEHSVKLALPTDDGGQELIWVNVTSIEGDVIEGKLAQRPVLDVGFQQGDEMALERGQVADWAVYRGDELVLGGFSIGDDKTASG